MDLSLKRKMSSLLKLTIMGSVLATTTNVASAWATTEIKNLMFPKKVETKSQTSGTGAKDKPNIVYIVLDDAGFSDLGSYGSEIKTPNMDKLSANGLRYNNFHANPMCSPTRASLLTGRNHHSVGMGGVANFDLGEDHHMQGRIKPEAATTAEVLKENGYSTFAVTKWHAAPLHEITPAGPFDNWPLGKGFERFYGFLESHADQFMPELVYDNHMVDVPEKENYHVTEDFVDHAMQFVTDQESITPDKPFFLYLGVGAPHAPIQVPQKYIDMYKGVYDKGWDQIRKERFERQKELGIIPSDIELLPRDPRVQAWDSLSTEEKRTFARFQEAYAGFLTHTDEQIGRFIHHLEEIGELDNSMIVLMSDNGASMESPNGSISFIYFMNGLQVNVKDLIPITDQIGGPEVRAAYPLGWAHVSGTPFKHYKQTTHNGGTAVPMIIHWPEGIKDKGRIRNQYYHVIDVTPTVYDILGIQAPETYKGIKQMPIHGISMADTFDNSNAPTKRTTQYFSMVGHRAIVHNGWKAVTLHKAGEPYENDKWELYHLDVDYAETNDLSSVYPEKLRELQALWWSEAEKYGALPFEFDYAKVGAYLNPKAVNNRNHFTYYQGMEHLGASAAPKIQNRSYTITAKVNRADQKTDGVLVANGDHMSGYTLYIKDNRLVYEYNYLGTIYKVVSTSEVPVGETTVRFEFQKTGPLKGKGLLFISDKEVGDVDMPKTFGGPITEEGLDVGRDLLHPVSKEYADKGAFEFGGKIHHVKFDLKNDQLAPQPTS